MNTFDLIVQRWSNNWTFDLRTTATAESEPPDKSRRLDPQTIARVMDSVSTSPYRACEMGPVLGRGAVVGTAYIGEDGTSYLEWNQTAVCLVYDID